MVRIRRLVWLCVILVLGTACTGAAPDGPPASSQQAAQNGPLQTIRVAGAGDATLESLIAAFYEKHPNYRVEAVAIPPEDEERMVRDKIANGELDVVPFNPSLVKDGLLLDLDAHIQKSRFDLKPLGSAVEQLRWDGKLYDLPIAVHPQVLFYNKDLFRKVGVPIPGERWTWEQLREAARQLSHGTGGERVWGLAAYNQGDMVSMWIAQRAGLPPWQADERVVREAMQFFATLIFSDKSLPQDPNPTSPEWKPRRDFQAGKSAVYLANWLTNASLSRQVSFDWDVAPLPTLSGEPPAAMVWPRTYGIPTTSKNQEAAWQFLSFIGGPDGAAVVAKMGHIPMYRTPAVQKAWFDRQPAPPAGTAALFQMDWIIRPRNEDSRQRQLEMTLMRFIGQAISGQKPWEEAHAEYVKSVNQIRQQGQP